MPSVFQGTHILILIFPKIDELPRARVESAPRGMGYFLGGGEAFPSVGPDFDALPGLERVGACDIGRRDKAAEDFFDLIDSGEGFLGDAGRVFLCEVCVKSDLPARCHGDVGECEGGRHRAGK